VVVNLFFSEQFELGQDVLRYSNPDGIINYYDVWTSRELETSSGPDLHTLLCAMDIHLHTLYVGFTVRNGAKLRCYS